MEGRTHHIRVARVLRDRLEAFIAGTGVDVAPELQRILDVAETELAIPANDCEPNNNNMAVSTKRLKSSAAVHERETIVCGQSCLEHEDLTRPNVWHRLPRELLPRIFARLPFAAIVRLKSVSKAWLESVNCWDSEFSYELEATNHKRIAFITPIDDSICPVDALPGRYQVRIYDVQEGVWHFYIIQPMPCASCMLGASDGGLVCFVLIKVVGPRSIVVVNPLTMACRNLPPLHKLSDVQPAMAQLTVDANTGYYKVVVAGYLDKERRELEVEVYDSETDEWTAVDSSERSYGYEFYWDVEDWDDIEIDEDFSEHRRGPCVCAEGILEELFPEHHMKAHWLDDFVGGLSLVLMKNHLIVLHKVIRREVDTNSTHFDVPTYCITEYECKGSACVEVAAHRCDPLDKYAGQNYAFSLYAACGFLMVFTEIAPHSHYPDCGWLYDMSTETWCDLPPLPKEYWFEFYNSEFLCEIKLSAEP